VLFNMSSSVSAHGVYLFQKQARVPSQPSNFFAYKVKLLSANSTKLLGKL